MFDCYHDYEYQTWYEDYRRISDNIPMTPYERQRVRAWIKTGHDFYNNPWGYEYGDGFEKDYLDALRTDDSNYRYRRRIAEER